MTAEVATLHPFERMFSTDTCNARMKQTFKCRNVTVKNARKLKHKAYFKTSSVFIKKVIHYKTLEDKFETEIAAQCCASFLLVNQFEKEIYLCPTDAGKIFLKASFVYVDIYMVETYFHQTPLHI